MPCWARIFQGVAIIAVASLLSAQTSSTPVEKLISSTGKYDIERYLNIRSAEAPSYSSSGEEIAYLTNITGTNQVWKTQVRGGWPEQLTFFEDRVQSVHWSPRGDAILFTKDRGGDERSQLYLMDSKGETTVALTNAPKVIHAFGDFSWDGSSICYSSNERNERFFDVYVMNLASRKPRRLFTGEANYYALSFSPNGRYVLAAREDSSYNNDLFLIEVQSGSAANITPHSGEAYYQNTAWLPNSSGFYLSSNQGRDNFNLAFYDVAKKQLRFVEESPQEIDEETGITIDRQGRHMAYAWNDNGTSALRIRDMKSGRVETFRGLPRGVISQPSFSRDGARLTFSYMSPGINSDVWVLDLQPGATKAAKSANELQGRQITHSSRAGIPSPSFVEPQAVTYTSFDGTKIPAFLYLPKTAEAGKLPAIISVHGGPESQERPTFKAVNQYFLNRGYAILAPNIRGSAGFGRKYLHMDDYKKRMDAIRDVAQGVEYLKSTGKIDPSKIVIMGGSYGGFMTLAQATMNPDLWAAAVDIVGIANWSTFFKNTGAWRRSHRAAEYGDPEKDPEFMASISPINHVEKIKAPLFVIAGANDPRVPKNEADQMVERVRAKGVPVEYISFPDEGHGMAKRSNRIRGYTAIADFLDKYVKNATASTSANTDKIQ
jgi:dipeptidyl aminopeptidase/acylaminoacyl peptidase